MYIHLKNDKPTHNSFNIISYDRTRFKDIHFENNAIKGFKWIILLLCFCLNYFVSCYNFSKSRIPLYILIKCIWTNTWKTGYIGKGLAINRAMKNFSCSCQQFTNSHENKFITNSRTWYCNPLYNCNNKYKRNSIKIYMGFSFKTIVEFYLYSIQ